VPDVKDFNVAAFFVDAVSDDMWQSPVQQFAGAFLASLAPTLGEFLQ
jgi:hypothetical protein